ncbi:mediator of RNA polymerase II transcription subunit [Maudiozyma exigua]|uniref:Mediator of RNA polymerase II transcription subunit 20 n=1 Tax=Maudiozyma exigua TaxID=34358 RepID=A0A9P6WDN1_MAUEX|nr:mediator of RNA polymerase II transcription subunit [Kazachstania exigua]
MEEPWSIEFKTYRTHIKNYSEDSRSKLMYSMNFSHHPRYNVIIKNKLGLLLSSDKINESVKERDTRIQDLIENDCSTGFPESLDMLLGSKLTNMWEQRQILRGDAGETFRTINCIIRCINLFSSTGFKGLIIEIESIGKGSVEVFNNKVNDIKDLLKEINIADYQISHDTLTEQTDLNPIESDTDNLCNLAYQYVRVLEY